MKEQDIKTAVRKSYGARAAQESSCCGTASVCGGKAELAEDISKRIGYSDEEIKSVPDGANLGLGCGNPIALASLKEGETVLDLGSGAGFDCFLAARQVGKTGKVIGVDMTPEMIDRARRNAEKGRYSNVEFRLGEIENLPAPDNSVDAVVSNCVINLSPDKNQVFHEAFRVLKPGGKIMVSDIVLTRDLPEPIKTSIEAYVGCLAGAINKDAYVSAIQKAGFHDVTIVNETSFPVDFMANDPTVQAIIKDANVSQKEIDGMAGSVKSIKVHGTKPR